MGDGEFVLARCCMIPTGTPDLTAAADQRPVRDGGDQDDVPGRLSAVGLTTPRISMLSGDGRFMGDAPTSGLIPDWPITDHGSARYGEAATSASAEKQK